MICGQTCYLLSLCQEKATVKSAVARCALFVVEVIGGVPIADSLDQFDKETISSDLVERSKKQAYSGQKYWGRSI